MAWSVHIFTASGMIAAFMALIAIDQENWRSCFVWLFVCLIIDGLDGTLARRFKVKEVLPHIEGKSMDYVIDFASYMIVPAFFFYKAQMVEPQFMLLSLIVIIISSVLYYGKSNMVEDDQYFIGFPVLWNVVIYFLFFVFQNNSQLNLIAVLIFGILHFVPLKYAYPSRSRSFFWWHALASLIGLSSAAVVIWSFPGRVIAAEWLTVVAGIYFFLFAVLESLHKKS